MNIVTFCDIEENKGVACNDKYVSLAVIDDESNYDVFKNFGDDISDINGIINLIEKKS